MDPHDLMAGLARLPDIHGPARMLLYTVHATIDDASPPFPAAPRPRSNCSDSGSGGRKAVESDLDAWEGLALSTDYTPAADTP